MKPFILISRCHIGVVSLGLILLFIPSPLSAQNKAYDPRDDMADETTFMDPYSVSALFSAIEVRLTLSGENLFDTTKDTIATAQIVKTEKRDNVNDPVVMPGDHLISLDGVALKGRTLTDIAQQLKQSRAAGMPAWRIRRSLQYITIKFDGDWLIPLPGLTR